MSFLDRLKLKKAGLMFGILSIILVIVIISGCIELEIDVCSGLTNTAQKQVCYIKLAYENLNETYCQKLGELNRKCIIDVLDIKIQAEKCKYDFQGVEQDNCWLEIVSIYRFPPFCDKITDDWIKHECYEEQKKGEEFHQELLTLLNRTPQKTAPKKYKFKLDTVQYKDVLSTTWDCKDYFKLKNPSYWLSKMAAETCYLDVAKKLNDESICELIEDTEYLGACIRHVAEWNNRPDLCENILEYSQEQYDICYDAIDWYKNETKLCSEGVTDSCYGNYEIYSKSLGGKK